MSDHAMGKFLELEALKTHDGFGLARMDRIARAVFNEFSKDLRAEVLRLTTEAASREAEYSAGLVAAAETVRDLQVSHSQVVELLQAELAALVAECDAAKTDRDAMAVTMGDLLMKTVARRDFDEMRAERDAAKAERHALLVKVAVRAADWEESKDTRPLSEVVAEVEREQSCTE